MRGEQGGEENVRKFIDYVDALVKVGQKLPMRDGRANLSAMATACGFDRGVFYTNHALKALLDEAVDSVGLQQRTAQSSASRSSRAPSPVAGTAAFSSGASDSEILALRAEVRQLKSELARYEPIRRLMAEKGRMP